MASYYKAVVVRIRTDYGASSTVEKNGIALAFQGRISPLYMHVIWMIYALAKTVILCETHGGDD